MNTLTLNVNNTQTNDYLNNGIGNPNKVSSRYHGIDSNSMIEALQDTGLVIRKIQAPTGRGNLEFNKHIVRLTTPENIELLNNRSLNIEFPEVVIVNNNNSQGVNQVLLGVYRLVCSNGMILGNSYFESRIRHSSRIIDNTVEALTAARMQFDRVVDTVNTLKSIQVNKPMDYREFLEQEVILPMIKSDNERLTIRSNFNPQRRDDLSLDAWTILNRYQEYLIKGGIKYTRYIDDQVGHVKVVNGTTRLVKSKDKEAKLNQLIFNKTLEFFNVAA